MPPVPGQPPPGPAPEPQPGLAPSPEASTLALEFDAASWVEVRDASGRLLLTGEQPAASRQEVSGALPFSVQLGNASGVRLNLNGAAFPIPEGTADPVTNVARFAVGLPSTE